MAAVEDAEGIQERAYDLVDGGNQVELKALLEKYPGLDVDEYKNVDGWSTLYCACYEGHTECVRLLIDHKANVNAKDEDGSSALCKAVSGATMGNMGCAKLLVQHGADVNQGPEFWGYSYLFLVVPLYLYLFLQVHAVLG
jgi:ankyrin repeat protein